MKKIAIFLVSLITSIVGFAQTEETPNRILVTNTAGNYTGYVIDHLDNISFARVDGEVLAKVEINEVGLEEMNLTITRTPDCNYYQLAVIPTVTANQIKDDVNAIRYINSLPSDMVPVLYEDFSSGELTGIELNSDSEYSIFTVGYDRYGVAAGVFRADFVTPAPEIVGNPHVEAKLVEATRDSFTIEFTPNDDVLSYWLCAGEKGTMQQQYEMFSSMFGFSNFSDMIRMWGIETRGPKENTWPAMNPNTEYEVFIAMTDANGNFAPYEVFEVSTLSLGGHGDAYVDIKEAGYELSNWDGELKPTLSLEFTPNQETSCYRVGVYLASEFEEFKDEILADLCSDPFMPMAYWFHYEPVTGEYQIDLNTDCVAVAAGKNIDGVWGQVNEYHFTTPSVLAEYEAPAAPVKKGVVPRLMPKKKDAIVKGQLPIVKMNKNKVELK